MADDWFVAPSGNDRAPGTSSHPFETLERARTAVRKNRAEQRKRKQPAVKTTVWIAGGTYSFEKTFELGKEDSGEEGAEVVYRAAQGAKVYITGGKAPVKWGPVRSSKVLARMDPTARKKVFKTNLKKMGVANFGAVDQFPVEFFFADKPMTLARWPNDSWAKTGALPDGKEGLRFKVDDDRIARWVTAEDPWVFGFWFHLWSDQHIPIEKIDGGKKEILLGKKHQYGLRTGSPFIVENLLEELDSPCEWFLDRNTGILFFWPPENRRGQRAIVSVLKTPLVRIRDASHILLGDITFSECRGNAIEIQNSEQCQILKCTIRNTGKSGIVVKGGKKNSILACEISETGTAAIDISGGNRKTLEPGGHEVKNCNLHHYARINRTYQPGVRLKGVGHRVAHNEIHHAPHVAVLFTGNDHLLEYNHVHHVCQETDDAGAFYIGRDWTTRGHLIRYNHFHDIGNTKLGSYGSHHVYLDDIASGVTIQGNFFEGGNRVVLIGGGRDNTVENNLFIGSEKAIHVDDRGLRWTTKLSEGGSWGIYKKLRSVPFDQPPYSTRYPGLATILENNPPAPIGNRIERNILVGGSPYNFKVEDKSVLQINDNWIGDNPGFISESKRDFRLKANSPAKNIGFKPIPFNQIGPVVRK